tara:strand:- start:62 stop:400 length:339 start_codon:yes stop_codon:yes gene_type:complete
MKSKSVKHPIYYKRVIDVDDNSIIIEYVDNEFDENCNRKVKIKIFSFDKSFMNISDFLNKLNDCELDKLNRFIEIQNKVMKHHLKNKKYDSYNTVKYSLDLMLVFKKQFEIV